MPDRTRAWYREFLRLRALIKTPRERWMEAQAQGWELPFPECPPYGAQPPWQLDPSDYFLNSIIASACNTILRECRVRNALRFTDITIPVQPDPGPYIFRLDALHGFEDGGVITIRRSYWQATADTSWSPVLPAYLPKLDYQESNYLNDANGSPYQIAVEGNLIYLMPGPQTGGTLRLTVGSGVLAPLTDEEGYDGIPAAYDDAVNYVALREWAAITTDSDMQKRLMVFAPLAQKSIENLTQWFDNAALDDMAPSANFTTSITRYARRN